MLGALDFGMIPTSILTLMQAVCLVPPEFVSNCKSAKEKGDRLEYSKERTFAYELYRQWENLIENNEEDMVINAEVPKKISVDKYNEILSSIFGYTNTGKMRTCFFPDLVYHHSQYDSNNQELVCEIKTLDGLNKKNSPKLMTDLKKLSAYMKAGTILIHPFKTGVFVLLGGNMKDIKRRYRKTDIVEEKAKDIFCITYNITKTDNDDYVPIIEVMNLSTIITHGFNYLDSKTRSYFQIIKKTEI